MPSGKEVYGEEVKLAFDRCGELVLPGTGLAKLDIPEPLNSDEQRQLNDWMKQLVADKVSKKPSLLTPESRCHLSGLMIRNAVSRFKDGSKRKLTEKQLAKKSFGSAGTDDEKLSVAELSSTELMRSFKILALDPPESFSGLNEDNAEKIFQVLRLTNLVLRITAIRFVRSEASSVEEQNSIESECLTLLSDSSEERAIQPGRSIIAFLNAMKAQLDTKASKDSWWTKFDVHKKQLEKIHAELINLGKIFQSYGSYKKFTQNDDVSAFLKAIFGIANAVTVNAQFNEETEKGPGLYWVKLPELLADSYQSRVQQLKDRKRCAEDDAGAASAAAQSHSKKRSRTSKATTKKTAARVDYTKIIGVKIEALSNELQKVFLDDEQPAELLLRGATSYASLPEDIQFSKKLIDLLKLCYDQLLSLKRNGKEQLVESSVYNCAYLPYYNYHYDILSVLGVVMTSNPPQGGLDDAALTLIQKYIDQLHKDFIAIQGYIPNLERVRVEELQVYFPKESDSTAEVKLPEEIEDVSSISALYKIGSSFATRLIQLYYHPKIDKGELFVQMQTLCKSIAVALDQRLEKIRSPKAAAAASAATKVRLFGGAVPAFSVNPDGNYSDEFRQYHPVPVPPPSASFASFEIVSEDEDGVEEGDAVSEVDAESLAAAQSLLSFAHESRVAQSPSPSQASGSVALFGKDGLKGTLSRDDDVDPDAASDMSEDVFPGGDSCSMGGFSNGHAA